MKMKNLLTYFSLLSVALATSASAEIINLTNGDRLTGEIVSSNDVAITMKTPFGQVVIPKGSVSLVSTDTQDEALAKGASDAVKQSATAAATSAAVAPAESAAPADPAAPSAEAKEPEWVVDYRAFVKEYFPEDWSFRLRGGAMYKETTSSLSNVNVAFDAKHEWGLNRFMATLYYDYTTETSVNDIESTTTDNYGIDTAFRHDFDESSHWYWENLLSYRRDRVKGIKDQVDEAITVGYRFDLTRYNVTIDIAPGPAVRYINAKNYDTHWMAMAVLAETVKWEISKLLRFEQNGYLGFNVEDPSEYSAYIKLAFIMHATEVMDIAIRYSYDYDSANASDAQKTEQTLLLSFEFPFNWK